MTEFDRFIRSLKEVVDAHSRDDFRAHGPMELRLTTRRDEKGKPRPVVHITAGQDHNYGGEVTIEASATGKSLRVFTSSEVSVEAA